MAANDLDDDDRYIDDHAQMLEKLLDEIIISSIQKAQSRGVSKIFSSSWSYFMYAKDL